MVKYVKLSKLLKFNLLKFLKMGLSWFYKLCMLLYDFKFFSTIGENVFVLSWFYKLCMLLYDFKIFSTIEENVFILELR